MLSSVISDSFEKNNPKGDTKNNPIKHIKIITTTAIVPPATIKLTNPFISNIKLYY